jgi:hypothetical protein
MLLFGGARRMSYRRSYSYGYLPPLKEIEAGMKDADGLTSDDRYPMELGASDVRLAAACKLKITGSGAHGKPRYELTAKQLHSFITKLVNLWNEGDEEAGSLASSILETLDIEWI